MKTKTLHALDGKTFKRQKDMYVYTQVKINEIKNGSVYPGDEHFAFIHHILDRHDNKTEKIGCGVKRFEVSDEIRGGKRIQIYRRDDSKVDFSWVKCVKLNTGKGNLNTCFRNAIRPQIEEFRKTSIGKNCDMCSASQDLQVDHVKLFSHLTREFVKLRPPSEVYQDPTQPNNISFVNADYAAEWQRYHADNCTLRILCGHCNQSRPKSQESVIRHV